MYYLKTTFNPNDGTVEGAPYPKENARFATTWKQNLVNFTHLSYFSKLTTYFCFGVDMTHAFLDNALTTQVQSLDM